MTQSLPASRRNILLIVAVLVPLAIVFWAFWGTLAEVANAWSSQADYSHGFLVPLFAVFLLWLWRDKFPKDRFGPSLFGLPLVAGGVGLWLYGTYFNYEYLE